MDVQMNERTQVARVWGFGPGSLRPGGPLATVRPRTRGRRSHLHARVALQRFQAWVCRPRSRSLGQVKRLSLLALVGFVVSACSGGGLSALGPASGPAPTADAPSVLVVRNVAADTSSVKVGFDAVPGAADYRMYDVSDPAHMKYAGLVLPASRKGPLTPNLQIEWNGLVPGHRATLIVEAVDRLGPFPATGVASFDPPLPQGCSLAASAVRVPAALGAAETATFVAGADAGPASNGAVAANGRGCPSDVPGVIARSAPVAVSASGVAALPSSSSASQVFFDGFGSDESGTLNRIVAADPIAGSETFTLGRPPVSWTVLVDNADVANTSAFIAGGQFNDVLFDQPAARANPALRSPRASFALVPNATADFSGGRILHATVEIDSHFSSRRAFSIDLAPATDPLASPAWSGTPNRSASALSLEVTGSAGGPLLLDEYAGARSAGNAQGLRVLGPSASLHESFRTGTDAGLDDRERWDLFVSQSHFAILENGARVSEYDFPAPLPFAQAKVYFVHSLDHSAAELATLKSSAPWEDDWIANVPFSDERHWNNAGFEVLPATTAWNSLVALVKMPEAAPPTFGR